jgi:hypothetical protein
MFHDLSLRMQNDATHIIQIIFALFFFGLLAIGAYVLRHWARFFGPNPEIPSENASARTYTKVQFAVVWLHALGLTGAFALLVH